MGVVVTPPTSKLYWSCVERIDYSRLPEPDRHSMRLCVERGISPGSGLQLILENNLKAIFIYRNFDALQVVATWVQNDLPLPIWGSRKKLRAWMDLAAAISRGRCTSGECKSEFSAVGL